MKKHIYVTLISLFICIAVNAQMSRLYTMEQGLTTTRLSSSYIDRDGLLWVMGEHMLAFFDGGSFHSVIDEKSDLANKISVVYTMAQIGDNEYYIGTGYGLFLFDSKQYTFTQIDLGEPKVKGAIPGYPISSINLADEENRAVVTTSGFGTFMVDYKNHKIDKKLSDEISNTIEDKFVYATIKDKNGNYWFSTSIEPIIRIDAKTHKREPVNIAPELENKLKISNPIMCMCVDEKTHNVIMGAPGVGVLIYDSKSNTVREIAGNSRYINARSVIYTKLQDVFVGTDNNGIMKFSREDESLKPVEWSAPGHDLRVSKVHHMVEDAEGNLVASLYNNGVLIVPSHLSKMTYIPVSRSNSDRNSSPVTCFLNDGNRIWIGTDGSGVFVSEKNLQARNISQMSDGLNLLQMTSFAKDANGNVWTSSYGGGIQKFENGKWVVPPFVAELSRMSVLDIETDLKTNKMYVSVNGVGLIEVDINAQTVTKIEMPEIANRWVYKTAIDSKRNIWVLFATGMCYFNLDTKKATTVSLADIGNAKVNAILAVGDKLYAGTDNGLAVYSYAEKKLLLDPVNEKLHENRVMSIIPSGKDLWLALSKSVACVSGADQQVTNYASFPGFYIGELQRSSCFATKDGLIGFGGDNGIVAISANFANAPYMNIENLFITGLEVNGVKCKYNPDENEQILSSSILTVEKINLDYDQNTFRLNFGSTEYAHADEIVYEYTLEGYEDIWHSATVNSAYYSSVPPGRYTFRLKAHYNYSDKYIEKSITIVICHPWYQTWWAMIIYLLVVVAIAYGIWRFRRARAADKAKMLELQHEEQVKESKLRLFTSIAHELRTPLTMVVSPLKQLKSTDADAERQGLYSIMQRNCDRLLNIVKQITDVRKIDNGQLRLHFTQFDFNQYCNDIMESFSGIAKAKNIQFTLFSTDGPLLIWADNVHFEKILINILSNAFKFTPANGKVLVSADLHSNTDGTFADKRINQYLTCSVYNSGSHINEQDLAHIYERFYQGSTESSIVGSGIGLNLCYELVKLHHGTIEAENINPDGVEFTIRIPIESNHLTEEELKPRITNETAEIASHKTEVETLTSSIQAASTIETSVVDEEHRRQHVLFVDDDRELCDYMRSQLENDYNITVCFSGSAAWKQVLSLRPDIVITDYKMADGDGMELANNIKQNPETSHITIIMLTAENDEQSHIDSLAAGIDHYLTKPFNIMILRSLLEQVTRSRNNLLSKRHRTDIHHDFTKVEMESFEDKFYQKVNETIKEHLDDSDFTVEALAREVGVSRVHLNRKLKEHYGISPNAFIRSVRLKQAAYLLVNNKVNISEVAYKVGFASHSYFSNNFHEYFGMTPTEFVAYYSENMDDDQLKKLLE
ncbi:MAG: helix-turn-helix domain-containing protein [Prevotellaceae bacterium]|nr:helix-turn-helix domain-containing protein [Candidatus Minthosoma caballi]